MHPILASDFGNLGAFLLGVPALGLALLIGIPSRIFRVGFLTVLCGVVCLLAGGLFFLSLPAARPGDRWITVIFGLGSVVAGVVLMKAKRGKPS